MFSISSAIQSYTSTLSNAIDDIESFEVPELIVGDIVRFKPYYESDEGGVGIVKKITTCEFKNKDYDPTDPESEVFVELPCAIVVSALPTEQWLDYVVLTHLEIMSLDELMQEYADEFPEQNEDDLRDLRVQVARKLSDFRHEGTFGKSHLSTLPTPTRFVSVGVQ